MFRLGALIQMSVKLILTLAIGLAAANHAHAAQGIEKIKLAIPAKSMGYLPLYVAIHRGFMRDEGLDLEIPNLRPNIAHSALLGGDIDYHGLAESGLRLAAMGSPMKSLFYSLRSPLYFLTAKQQIHSVQELKGKIIGISSFGGAKDSSSMSGLTRPCWVTPDALPIVHPKAPWSA